MPVVTYYLGPNSPWTYLGHARFMHLAERFGLKIVARPIDLPRVFRASGGLVLSERAIQRRTYRLAELARFSEHLKIPLHPEPRHFPVSSDLAAKLLIAADQQHGVEVAMNLLGRIGSACWADQKNIADEDTLAALAVAAGLDGTSLLKHARAESIDANYQRNTDEAIERGVFGAPTYVLGDDMFWGQDRLMFLETALTRNAGIT